MIKVAYYPQWVTDVILVPQKDRRVRMWVDFKDLNKARLEDDFLPSHIDVLVNNTVDHSFLSFVNGYVGYNFVKIEI